MANNVGPIGDYKIGLDDNKNVIVNGITNRGHPCKLVWYKSHECVPFQEACVFIYGEKEKWCKIELRRNGLLPIEATESTAVFVGVIEYVLRRTSRSIYSVEIIDKLVHEYFLV
jgi:hypothetical protein